MQRGLGVNTQINNWWFTKVYKSLFREVLQLRQETIMIEGDVLLNLTDYQESLKEYFVFDS